MEVLRNIKVIKVEKKAHGTKLYYNFPSLSQHIQLCIYLHFTKIPSFSFIYVFSQSTLVALEIN